MSTAGPGSEGEFFVRFQPGDTVFREGEPGDSMFIVEDGTIEILRTVDETERTIATLEQGDFFGEMAVLDDEPREATARATSETQLLRIDRSTFNEMLRQNPEIAVRMLRKLARRLRMTIGVPEAAAPEEAPQAAPPEVAGEGTPAIPVRRTLKFVVSGEEFELPLKAEITVGRPDPVTGTVPDIDLTAHDTNRSVSRRHAKIYHRDGGFLVCEEVGTANGTFVNGERVRTGVPVRLANDDVVSFGRVEMVFHEE